MHNLPSVSELLNSPIGREIAARSGEKHAADLIRAVIGEARSEIGNNVEISKTSVRADVSARLSAAWLSEQSGGTHRVINATGVVIHTNLGRAPLSEKARRAINDEASGYCTLEYDIETGNRGRRAARAEELIVELTGAESAIIVNNCAAAAFFVLSVFASGGEVIISRGELVEIGGDFRVPDVLEQSGATLVEVGTTNRTRGADYRAAVTDRTRMILRVHPSNYRIVGFTASPGLTELAEIARVSNVLFYEDIGSGALIDLSTFGLADEPVVSRSIAAGADVVTFSGDKLLGGPQAGIIAGRREIIDRLRAHPLYRALRVDKLAIAALEATLDSYRRDAASSEVPVLQMLSMSKEVIEARARDLVERLDAAKPKGSGLVAQLEDGVSAIGGGAAPAAELATKLIAIKHQTLSAARLEQLLRMSDPGVITRIADGRVMIDLRTVSLNDEPALLTLIAGVG